MTESDSKCDDESFSELKKTEHPCSGLHCKNNGKYKLTIKFTHRSGFFCSKCYEYLQENELLDISPNQGKSNGHRGY
jgi:hypothetical protein